MCGGCTSGSENKESKVGGRLLKQLFWVCSPFTLMSSPKRVNRWWDAEPELCLVENLAGSAVLQPQNAAEKADFCTTYIYSFCCTREEIAEDLVPVPEIPTELQDVFAAAGNMWHCGLYWSPIAQTIPLSFLGFLQRYPPNYIACNNFSFAYTKLLS